MKITKKAHVALDLLVIIIPLALLLITPVMWFVGFEGRLILSGDSYFPIDPNSGLSSNLFVWADRDGGGSYNYLINSLPFFSTIWLLYQLFPLWITQLLFFGLIILITFGSFFFLTQTVFTLSGVEHCKKVSLSSSVLSAFLYTFNPYMLNIWYMQYLNLIFFVAFLPLALACFLVLLRELRYGGQHSIKWLLLSFFASIPLSIVDFPFFVLFLGLIILLGIYYMIAIPGNRKLFLSRFASYFSLFIVLIMLVNVWWWPNYLLYSLSYSQIDWRLGAETSLFFFRLYTKPSTLVELFRFVGDIDFYVPNRIPAGGVYVENPILIIVGFIILLLSLTTLLPRLRERKSSMFLVYFFTVVYLLSIFFVKGANPPLGDVTMYLFEYVPVFRLFRAPWRRLMGLALLSLCTLLAFSLQRFANPKINKPIKILTLIMLIAFGWAQISGNIFNSTGVPTTDGVKLKPAHAEVPEYYYSAANYINRESEQFSIMFFPFYPFYGSLSWGYYASWYPLNIFHKPIVNLGTTEQQPSGNIEKVLKSVISDLYQKPSYKNGEILGRLFNVKYVLVLKDWDTEYEPLFVTRVSPDQVEILLPAAGFYHETTFGNVSIYRNPYWTKDTSIYAANVVVDDDQLYSELMMYYENVYSFVASKRDIVFMRPEDRMKISEINRISIDSNNSIVLDDDQATFWSSNGAVLSDDLHVRTSGNNSLKVLVSDEAPVSFWWINYDFEKNIGSMQDWSKRDYISFYWHGQGTGATIILAIYATYSDRYETTFIDDFIGWKKIMLPLSEFASYGSPSLKKVSQLQFYCSTAYTSGLWHIDLVEVGNSRVVQLYEFKEYDAKLVNSKIDSTKYVVKVNTTNPFILVMGQSYNPNWRATIDGLSSDFLHFQVNGYQNGWYLNKTGEYVVTIEYWPQSLFIVGLVVSSSTLIVCAYVLVSRIGNKKSGLKAILFLLHHLRKKEEK